MYTDYAKRKITPKKKLKYRHVSIVLIMVLVMLISVFMHYSYYKKRIQNQSTKELVSQNIFSSQQIHSSQETKKIEPMQFDFYRMMAKQPASQ